MKLETRRDILKREIRTEISKKSKHLIELGVGSMLKDERNNVYKIVSMVYKPLYDTKNMRCKDITTFHLINIDNNSYKNIDVDGCFINKSITESPITGFELIEKDIMFNDVILWLNLIDTNGIFEKIIKRITTYEDAKIKINSNGFVEAIFNIDYGYGECDKPICAVATLPIHLPYFKDWDDSVINDLYILTQNSDTKKKVIDFFKYKNSNLKTVDLNFIYDKLTKYNTNGNKLRFIIDVVDGESKNTTKHKNLINLSLIYVDVNGNVSHIDNVCKINTNLRIEKQENSFYEFVENFIINNYKFV